MKTHAYLTLFLPGAHPEVDAGAKCLYTNLGGNIVLPVATVQTGGGS